MRRVGTALTVCAALFAQRAQGVVFINEVVINPQGSLDNTREFVELLGTPGMKLDGYAIAFVSGGLVKLHPLNSIPPLPEFPEIDEFFSLDGLSLGPNGVLVVGVGLSTFYGTLLADSNFQRWDTIWNGDLDAPGMLQNDGSNTVLLIRRRPGITQADPMNAGGLRWGKDINPDNELITPVAAMVCSGGTSPGLPCQDASGCLGEGATCVPGDVDQYGDGNLDRGDPDNRGGNTLDLKGSTTLGDVSDDLEIVDEISYEHEQGWEYDLDDRLVDAGSADAVFPQRNVHALDDPGGFNPDCLTRVDYRTKGAGWTPVAGATGQMTNGNNWSDTATEQWIRGEVLFTTLAGAGQGNPPYLYYASGDNPDPGAAQPYLTNVPLWLADGTGTDFPFIPPMGSPLPAGFSNYQVMAGRINVLGVPFIPGDADRDGDCDADDLAKIAAVFGDDDWIFSNSFNEAPEGDEGDPAEQTRPWDVDATGDNGIEASDLQWTLSFQGDTTGRIVGKRYDSTTPTPAGAGVHLNSNAGVACTVSTGVNVPSGRTLSTLKVGDLVEVTVLAEVTGGVNVAAGQENGVMQYVHDVVISAPGVLRVLDVQPAGAFATTRAALQQAQGAVGDLGVTGVNGHTTSFSEGLGGPASMYGVTLQAKGLGTADVTIGPAAAAKFAASTPGGLKVGHTDQQGNPESVTYPAALAAVVSTVRPDFDSDGDVDENDLEHLTDCRSGPTVEQDDPLCADARLDGDADVDVDDHGLWQRCATGPGLGPPPADCDMP